MKPVASLIDRTWRLPQRRRASGRPLAALVWLGFIAIPLVNAITNPGPLLGRVLAIAAAAVFVAAYVRLVLVMFDDRRGHLAWSLLGVLVAIAGTLTVADRPGWGFLFSYCAGCLAVVAPARIAFTAVVGCAALGTGLSVLGGATGGNVLSVAVTSLGVGLLLSVMSDLRRRNAELSHARAELAQAAVAAERERFARDLHDLLGHSLSVIALKAQLAGRLVGKRPAAAAEEIAEVEAVARQALGEVREAVSGYRRPTLDDELAGARMALGAAGIELRVRREAVALDPETEAVLAWAVREGATNVIRHSGASRCSVRVRTDPGGAAVEVIDDGGDGDAVNGDGVNGDGTVAWEGAGHGIAGLAERAERVRGRLESGRRLDGRGFRLHVSVPVADGVPPGNGGPAR